MAIGTINEDGLVNIRLNRREVAVIYAALGRIGGASHISPRGNSDDILLEISRLSELDGDLAKTIDKVISLLGEGYMFFEDEY